MAFDFKEDVPVKPDKTQTKLGDWISSLLISSIFLGIAAGSGSIVFGFLPNKNLPDFVPIAAVFGLLGGLYVCNKILEGLHAGLNRVVTIVLTLGLGMLGLVKTIYLGEFPFWVEGWPSESPLGELGPWLMPQVLTGSISAIFFAIAATYIGQGTRAEKQHLISAIAGFSITHTAFLIAYYVSVGEFPEFSDLDSGLGIGFIGAISLGILIWEKSWMNLHPYVAVATAILPLSLGFRAFSFSSPFAMTFAVLAITSTVIYLAFGFKNLLSGRWIQDVKLTIRPQTPKIGQNFFLDVSFNVIRDVNLIRVQSDLICFEHFSANPANNEESDTTEVSRYRLVGGFSEELKQGTQYKSSLKALLSADDESTHSSGSTSYYWELRTRIMLDGVPDWEDEQTVIISD